jgi:hypothetical protein
MASVGAIAPLRLIRSSGRRSRRRWQSMRKGEFNRSRLDREWPHHVALPAEAVRGPANAATVRGVAYEPQGRAALT